MYFLRLSKKWCWSHFICYILVLPRGAVVLATPETAEEPVCCLCMLHKTMTDVPLWGRMSLRR